MDTLFVGKNCFKLDEISSTNDWLMTRISNQKFHEGTVAFASVQTNGKGQRGSQWFSQPYKSLTFSVLLKPSFLSPIHAFDLSICVALALSDSLNKLRSGFKIKWPNDIYFEDKKIAGVLIENQMNRFVYQNAVVGIGLNVNQLHFDELSNAISLKQIIGIEFPVEKVMEHICESLEARYLMLRSGHFKDLKNAYMSNLYGLNKLQSFMVDNKKLNGKIIDVLRNGFLQIELMDGKIRDYDIKEIKFLSIGH
tara:strand:+ start:91 stop:846 length:756 start_codon:yes stop_codon:yes gene_type:complete